jgi:F420-0:gamma-glutamyl ligase-like protein
MTLFEGGYVGMKFGSGFSSGLEALGLALGIVAIVLGVNEATFDVLDRMGSNYWLAYSSVISGVALIGLILHRPRYRTIVASTVQKNVRKAC